LRLPAAILVSARRPVRADEADRHSLARRRGPAQQYRPAALDDGMIAELRIDGWSG
jgi:hypothetical protein